MAAYSRLFARVIVAVLFVMTGAASGPAVVPIAARAADSADGPNALRQQVEPKAPTALTATAVTRASVSLTWTAGDPTITKFVLERKVAGVPWRAAGPFFIATLAVPTPSAIAVVDGAQATDDKIDAFATYTYRVRAFDVERALLSEPSAAITVGPPRTGFSHIAAASTAMQEHDPNGAARRAPGLVLWREP